MLRAAEAGELAVHHDGQLAAQGLALLHAVRGEHHGPALRHHGLHAAPQEPTRAGVHAGRRLVLQRGHGQTREKGASRVYESRPASLTM